MLSHLLCIVARSTSPVTGKLRKERGKGASPKLKIESGHNSRSSLVRSYLVATARHLKDDIIDKMADVRHGSVTPFQAGGRLPHLLAKPGGWESFKIQFHGFADLPSAVGQFTRSPECTCNGHKWCVRIYPGGCDQLGLNASTEGNIALYLEHCSGGGRHDFVRNMCAWQMSKRL